MRRSTFTWNGQCSDEFGVYIERKPNINRSARKYKSASVVGRNGNIYQLQNAWDEVIVSYDIFAGGYNEGEAIEDFTEIMEWLNSADDYAVLSDSYDDNHYRMAVFVDETEIEQCWYSTGKATIKFRCKPQRYLVGNVLNIQNGDVIQNKTNHIAEPMITMTGPGAISLVNLQNRTLNDNPMGVAVSTYMLYPLLSSMNTSVYTVHSGVTRIGFTVNEGYVDLISPSEGRISYNVAGAPDKDYGLGLFMAVDPDTDYTFSCEAYEWGKVDIYPVAQDGQNEILGYYSGETGAYDSNRWQPLSISVHTPSNCGYIMLIFNAHDIDEVLGTDQLRQFRGIMLNRGQIALPFKPYTTLYTNSSLTINNQYLLINDYFTTAEIDCEKEILKLDGAVSNQRVQLTDIWWNPAAEYLHLDKGNNTIKFGGDTAAVSMDPRFWEL